MNGFWSDFRSAAATNRGLACSVAALPLWILGQVFRDAFWVTGLWFFIPSALLAAVLGCWMTYYAARGRPRAALLIGCLAAAPMALVLCVENRFCNSRSPVAPGDVRAVHWNVAGHLDRPGARSLLCEQRADVYVLSEIPDAAAVESLRNALGDEFQSQVFGNLAVVAKGRVQLEKALIDRHRTTVRLVTWEHQGRSGRLFVVDLPSELYVPRDPLLREINRLMDEFRPDLVVGDFNAPRRSWGLCELPDGYRHAYDTAGSGWGSTWPVPVPLWAIDQCLHSRRIEPRRYALCSSIHSDHRMQVFDFAWCEEMHEK
jgi:vancomycin resistance protein VanJ